MEGEERLAVELCRCFQSRFVDFHLNLLLRFYRLRLTHDPSTTWPVLKSPTALVVVLGYNEDWCCCGSDMLLLLRVEWLGSWFKLLLLWECSLGKRKQNLHAHGCREEISSRK